MGCTSSAPSTRAPSAPTSPASHVHATVQTELMDISEDRMQLRNMKDESVATELPVCDTVEEAVLSAAAGGVVVAVSAAAIADAADAPGPGPEPDTLAPIEVHNVEVPEASAENPTVEDRPASEPDEKLTKLEEVVEKVVELHVAGELEATSADATTEEAEAQGAPSDSQPEEAEQESEDEAEEEPASPSQSASSRATRWEALADIAAELPPSLTVDPLTGQIYALSK